MKDKEIETVQKLYAIVRDRFSHGQVNLLSSMIYSLNKEWEEREHIQKINREIDLTNRKCSWDKSFKMIPSIPVPDITTGEKQQ